MIKVPRSLTFVLASHRHRHIPVLCPCMPFVPASVSARWWSFCCRSLTGPAEHKSGSRHAQNGLYVSKVKGFHEAHLWRSGNMTSALGQIWKLGNENSFSFGDLSYSVSRTIVRLAWDVASVAVAAGSSSDSFEFSCSSLGLFIRP